MAREQQRRVLTAVVAVVFGLLLYLLGVIYPSGSVLGLPRPVTYAIAGAVLVLFWMWLEKRLLP